jgi:hypothetical protein
MGDEIDHAMVEQVFEAMKRSDAEKRAARARKAAARRSPASSVAAPAASARVHSQDVEWSGSEERGYAANWTWIRQRGFRLVARPLGDSAGQWELLLIDASLGHGWSIGVEPTRERAQRRAEAVADALTRAL